MIALVLCTGWKETGPDFLSDIILQEDVENLNEVAHNRPRAQLVLGIQQENRSGHRRNM